MRLPASALALLALPLAALSQAAQLPAKPDQLPPMKELSFTPPPLVRETLPNGLRLILLEDHRLPLVSVKALVKVGSVYDPADKVGLAALAGASLYAGGSEKHAADALNETLESLAAEMSSSIGQEEGELDLDLLAKDIDTGLPLFAEILTAPAFAPEKVEIEKNKLVEGIKRQNEDPFDIVQRESAKNLYGQASPWARTPSVAGVQKLTREDIKAFHSKYFSPKATIIAVAGDFDSKAMLAKLSSLFKGWAAKDVAYPEVAPAPAATPAGVVLMDKPDLTQSTLFVGELAGKRFENGTFNGDRYPMDVMNYILGGGGFNSTLMREIRSNRGLAYGAGSYYKFSTDRGHFQAYSQTGVENTAQVIGLVLDSLKKSAAAPPALEELKLAKDSLVNAFVFKYQRPSQIVNQAALYEMQGFPADYLAGYCAKIQKVTAEDVQKVAAKYLHPDAAAIFVLGPADKLKADLSKFGKVDVRPLPEP